MKPYAPEMGQAIFGNPTGEHPISNIGAASMHHALNEIQRVWTNHHQSEWNHDAPEIDGLEVRPYWWGNEDAPDAALPNLAWQGIEIRWYKHPGRGTSVNRSVTPDEWAAWLDSLLTACCAWEDANRGAA